MLLPKVEHRDAKRPQLLAVERPDGCGLGDDLVHEILGF